MLRILPLFAAVLPLLAIYGSYFINASLGNVEWCIPNISGCASVSRAARSGDGLFWFRLCMMPYSVILVLFWLIAWKWLVALGDSVSRRPFVMFVLGSIGAFALLTYATFLGSDGEVYRFLRRYGVIFFFALTGLAQTFLVTRLYSLPAAVIKPFRNSMRYMLTVCGVEMMLAFWHAYVEVFIHQKPYYNSNEWNFGIMLMLFPLGLFIAWNKTAIRWRIDVTLPE